MGNAHRSRATAQNRPIAPKKTPIVAFPTLAARQKANASPTIKKSHSIANANTKQNPVSSKPKYNAAGNLPLTITPRPKPPRCHLSSGTLETKTMSKQLSSSCRRQTAIDQKAMYYASSTPKRAKRSKASLVLMGSINLLGKTTHRLPISMATVSSRSLLRPKVASYKHGNGTPIPKSTRSIGRLKMAHMAITSSSMSTATESQKSS